MIEVKIPSPGESITEVEIADWLVENGDYVEKDQEIAEVESDKATLPLVAEGSGVIEILAREGDTIQVGEVACRIDTSAQAPEEPQTKNTQPDTPKKEDAPDQKATASESSPAEATSPPSARERKRETSEAQSSEATTSPGADSSKKSSEQQTQHQDTSGPNGPVKATPVARKMMEEHNLSLDDVLKGLRRITKQDVSRAIEGLSNEQRETETSPQGQATGSLQPSREEDRQKITRLRRKLSERLVSVKNETAMLTTFNEVDMSEVMALRKRYQKAFQEKHGIKLGLMSFFIKASALALQAYPNVNSIIDGDEMVYPRYADIGIAVQTPKGLMVPVIRNAEGLTLAGLERQVKHFGEKGQNNRITLDEMQGGTFSITNGGVFGSLLSTPIINPPQSAILGMHTIQDRPVAVDGQVEIRPMMYIALSYDHRTIDGKDSVSFLMKIKELVENPHNMLLPGGNADKQLLGI